MATDTKVSVIIYNTSSYAILESVLVTIYESKYPNYEVIVIDNNVVDETIAYFTKKYPVIYSKLDKISNSNSLTFAYNYAFNMSSGDVIIIQTSDIHHVGDIISAAAKMTSDDKIVLYPCALSTMHFPTSLNEIKTINKWYTSPNQENNELFCFSLKRKIFHKLRGFDNAFSNYKGYEFNEFIQRARNMLQCEIKVIEPFMDSATYTAVLSSSPISLIRDNQNKLLYEKSVKNLLESKISRSSRIPRVMHMYWHGDGLNYIELVSLKSFRYYNPEWTIKLHTFKKNYITFGTEKIQNLEISLDIQNGHESRAIEHIKWQTLVNEGGGWINLNILHVNSLENTIFKDSLEFDMLISKSAWYGEILDFYLTIPRCKFFEDVFNIFSTNGKYEKVYEVLPLICKNYEHLQGQYSRYVINIDELGVYKLFGDTQSIPHNAYAVQLIIPKSSMEDCGLFLREDGTNAKLLKYVNRLCENNYSEYYEIANPNYHRRINIVMAYYNRKQQTVTTLDTIALSSHKNFAVIIVDDGSEPEHQLDDIINNYLFEIKLIKIAKSNKKWVNPCVPYNIGLNHTDSEIVFLQNPEVCHIGDVIMHANNNLTRNDYYTYSCYASPHFSYNNELTKMMEYDTKTIPKRVVKEFIGAINYADFSFDWNFYKNRYDDVKTIPTEAGALEHWRVIGQKEGRQCNAKNIYSAPEYVNWKGWYNHPEHHRRPLHFLSATYKSNLNKIKNFNESYASGYWYDDDDLLHRLTKITNLNIIPPDGIFGIHQYHSEGSVSHTGADFNNLIAQNRKLYATYATNMIVNDISKSAQYTIVENRDFKKVPFGVAITTYSDGNTTLERLNIIDESLTSLKNSGSNILVVIVVDGSFTPEHKKILDKFNDIFKIIYREKNGGISLAKNTAISELIKRGITVGFLADDDIIYHPGWNDFYIKTLLETGVEHFCYWPSDSFHTIMLNVEKNRKPISHTLSGISGCFLTFTKKIIHRVGYFRKMPYLYGFEHEEFTGRCIGASFVDKQYDGIDSSKYIKLNSRSIDNQSRKHDIYNILKNQKFTNSLKYDEYVHCIE